MVRDDADPWNNIGLLEVTPQKVRGQGADSVVLMPHHDTVIQSEDHVIVFVENKRIIPRVEKLFQVSVGFF